MKINFTLPLSRIFFFLLLIPSVVKAQSPTDVFISEYVEGSSNNKAIEIYNGTGATIDLTAGNYVIQMYFNGSTTAGLTISLSGTVTNNSVFVLAHASASFASSSFVNQTNSSGWFNGDDAVVLKKGGASGTIVDVIGQVGFDPGAEWGTSLTSTADNTLRRKSGSCTGDVNASDVFDPSVNWDGYATDDFTGLGSHTSGCVAGPSISVAPASLSFTTTAGVASGEQSYTIQGSSLTEDITVTVPLLSNFGLSLVSGGPYTNTITVPFASANSGSVTVYVIFNPSSPGTQSGNVTHVSGANSANLAVSGTATTSSGYTPVYTIQGSGSASALDGTVVTTEGIVTGDFQNSGQLNGFYIQDTTGDVNNLTSDGIFVFNTTFAVSPGDYVRITGEVDEFNNKTELKNLSSLSILSSGNQLPQPISIQLPVNAIADLESYEGMLTTFPQTLTVTETFTLGRFGELSLSVDGRVINPTNFVDPNDNPASGTNSTGGSNVAAVSAQQSLNDRRRILLDDGSNVQNPAVVPYLNPADTTLRSGTTLQNLTGILDYDFSEYRIQPVVAPVFNYAPRPSVPSVGMADIKVASFNVLNFFNGDGLGGGFPTARGANTLEEFNRQRVKTINAIKGLNADVIGLTEIENDGDGPNSAIADLVNGLNSATAAGTYSYILDPTGANGNTGTDAIKVAIIYKPAAVTPEGLSKSDTNPVHNRPPLVQTFTINNSVQKFSFIINHFKSKSCTGASGANVDQLDGQGCYNDSRKLQANALLAFISSIQTATGDSDVIALGDFNSYTEEDPVDILRAGGLTNLSSGAYSYVFDGQAGSLDQAFVTGSFLSSVTGVQDWHINADEPIIKDYNQEFNQAYVYSTDAYRSSDHDPVLVGLRFANIPPAVTITSPSDNSSYPAGVPVTLSATAGDADGSVTKVAFYNNGIQFAADSTAPYEFTGSEIEPRTYVVTAKAFDNAGDSTVSDTIHVTITGCSGTGAISAYGYTGIPGTSLTSLGSDPDYPANPDIITQVPNLEYGPNFADNYGGRLRGYICAPQTGYYLFYIASDEQSELWLSTDDNPANVRRIAYVETKVGFRSYYTYPSQRSVSIRLVKGVRYYIETVHKEGTGNDHLSVAWILPGGAIESPIPGSRLSPYESLSVGASGRTFEQAMRTVSDEKINGLEVKASPNPSESYFTLQIKSNSEDKLTITVTDALGRVVEEKTGVAANGSIQIGSKLVSGMYFVEVVQGAASKKLKLVKQ